MGDGANDIPMILEAGFGIAYRAKPKTEANADACVRFGGLEADTRLVCVNCLTDVCQSGRLNNREPVFRRPDVL